MTFKDPADAVNQLSDQQFSGMVRFMRGVGIVLLALAAVVLMLGTSGCGREGDTKQVATWEPVNPVCNAKCYQPCTPSPTDTGVRWEGDPNRGETTDALGDAVTPQLSEKLLSCEAARDACTQCLDRLEQQKVIVPQHGTPVTP